MTTINKTKEAADKVLKCYDISQDAFAQAIQDSEKAIRYVNNNQWSSTDKGKAENADKPALTYNLIVPIISTLQGNEQLNRRRARIKPQTISNVEMADVIQGRWNALNDEQNIEEMLQLVFVDALSTKVGGYIERRFEITEDGFLDFRYNVTNNMRLFLDPETRANDYRLKNCRWIVKEGWESLDVIKEKYGLKPEDYNNEDKVAWWNNLTEYFKRISDGGYSNVANYDKENDRYKILEMQERVVRKMYHCFDGENYMRLEPKQFVEAKKMIPNLKKIMEYETDGIHLTTIIPYFENAVVLDEDDPSPSGNFDVFPVYSYNYNVQVSEQTSLVDLLIDVQDDVNKGKSQIRDYVTQILSGGVFIDKREKEAIKKLKEKGNQPNQVYELNNPAAMPQKLPPGQIPPDIMNNAENSFGYAQRVSLISEAMRGESARSGESGVLFQQKVQRAAAAINPYFYNLSRLRKALVEDFVDNFGFVYAEQARLIKIQSGEGMHQEVIVNLVMAGQTINDTSNPSMYVELDEGEDNITAKEENFNRLLALINLIGQFNPELVDVETLLAQAPVPGAKEMLAYVQQMKQAQAEAAQREQQRGWMYSNLPDMARKFMKEEDGKETFRNANPRYEANKKYRNIINKKVRTT